MNSVKVQSSIDLSTLNTLNVVCTADRYIELEDEQSLIAVFQEFPLDASNMLVLGGGSNVILPLTLRHTVLSFRTKTAQEGVVLRSESQDAVLIDVASGVIWDELVDYSVQQQYSGLENLSLIPGTVGAAPIQNIGAYGVEIADKIEQVKVFNVATKCVEFFSTRQCEFAYRDSIFKRQPGQFIILGVTLRLSKTPDFVLGYGELSALKGAKELTQSLIRATVIATRQAKLPDPKQLPNAGSFFKNPIISSVQFTTLKQAFPDIVNYPLENGQVKLAAAWLIDQAGWKGYRNEHVGLHDKQALVLVNHNHGTQADILALAALVQDSVFTLFHVSLEIEPVLISSHSG